MAQSEACATFGLATLGSSTFFIFLDLSKLGHYPREMWFDGFRFLIAAESVAGAVLDRRCADR